LEKAIDAVVKYAISFVPCDHIRVELNHFKDDSGSMKVDTNIKNAYTKNGFRWKTLNNDPVTGKRAQIMQL